MHPIPIEHSSEDLDETSERFTYFVIYHSLRYRSDSGDDPFASLELLFQMAIRFEEIMRERDYMCIKGETSDISIHG